MAWLRDVRDDIYDPSYTDMLRVAFSSEFRGGKLQDLVVLLSGRNFETKEFEEAIAEQSFARLKQGILAFMNKAHFERLVMILRSAGFVASSLISGYTPRSRITRSPRARSTSRSEPSRPTPILASSQGSAAARRPSTAVSSILT